MIVTSGQGLARRPVPLGDENARRREADHRIANSLQLLSALLSSQGREVSDPAARAALETSVQRIGAIARVHRQLYRSHGENGVDLCAYLMDLLAGLQDSFSCENRQIQLEAEPVITPSDFAGIIGIIVTELVINACKHAYTPGQQGASRLCWRSTVHGDSPSRFEIAAAVEPMHGNRFKVSVPGLWT